ncbi:tudor domain-containing protein 10 isoform X2 [Erpetoichthys calabaricus]|uniref:tudor domain-containing protein 10 isoform X2 n=1 Tax=Erpetoichthys calabaricus TaxID=27687 RepID=UPI002234D348|nr:tudor domain-containing protein 10 isoform X2 [Erpetoichthys calabaricus]
MEFQTQHQGSGERKVPEIYVGNLPTDISEKSSLPEKTKDTEFIKASIPPTKDKSPSCKNAIFIKNCRKIFYAVPMEMRSLMLMSILNECFGNLNWFGSIMKDEGETAVMVTETYPETPFFWAIQLSEVSQNKMVTLFTAIAKSEKNQPYLGKDDAHRGKKCLAEFLFTPHDAGAWNRACILEVVNFFALVFFVDFGSTAFIPIYSLKFLSEEEFWQIPPLTQPFMLEEDVFCKERLVKTVLRGKIVGSHMCEHHIHRFVPFSEEARFHVRDLQERL